jgi:predicted nuclease of predicted toxin-antitoxin system
MRILLDAHVSGPRVGQRLTADGHDVRALDQEPGLEGLDDDDDVLALAASEDRILITHNVRDFPAIVREWTAAGREHSGVILAYGVDHRAFDVIVRGIERCFGLYPEPAAWRDLAVVVSREFAVGS